jgi:hypothetical protein
MARRQEAILRFVEAEEAKRSEAEEFIPQFHD